MLAGAAQPAVQPEIGTVNLLRLLDPSLLEQKGAQRMSRRLHPPPRFVVGKRVAEFDSPAQVRERCVMVALSVFQLAVQHTFGDAEQADQGVVVGATALWYSAPCQQEQDILLFGLGDIAERRMSDRL